MKKYFVLDTNVLLHSPTCLSKFQEHAVVIPVDVIEELDKFKSHNDELGRNARAVIRVLDRARASGSLASGAPINEAGGSIQVDLQPVCLLEHGMRNDTADNRILSTAYRLMREGHPVCFISKDANMRVKCDALGIPSEDFESDKVPAPDVLYSGWRAVECTEEHLATLSREREVELTIDGLNANEVVLLREQGNPKRTVLARPRRKLGDGRVLLRPFEQANDAFMGITARNLEQRVALELLTDPSISLVTMIGQAGTGKTLLALVAGLHLTVRKHLYEKLLVARPIMPLGRDIGFLPGSAEEKLLPWMKPIFDNMKFVLREKREPGEADKKMMELFKSGVVEIEPLTFIRGRSIHGHFMIVDECQNLTPHQVKTIISRVGHDTKLVLTGDPYQIDNPYLDSQSNGLTYVAERFKDQEVAGHVLFTRSERSKLASIAVEIL
ncbi:MAG: PhoH family protein [Planctomycetes bacterium]|nr:PhoH family protein [Planctomycetota bacterium]